MKKEINIISIIAITMCIVLVLTCVIKHVGTNNSGNKDESVYTGIDDVSIEGDSSFGQLFALALGEKVKTINENNNYVIYSVEIEGDTANVKYNAQQDCTLVVNICDETGENVLGNGSTKVYADEGFASVKISADNMPEFFLIKASLVETNENTLLSTEYLSPMYSREMQELMEMTIYDFDEDRVINLDDSVENNFAVYKKDVVVFSAENDENILVSCDYGNYEYIISNPDETVKKLKQGDTFSYRYYDDEYIIDTVESIEEDGGNIVICGAKTSMEEVFDYVKIDTASDMSAAEYNAETKDDGVGEAQWMAYPENGVYLGAIEDTPVKNTLSYNNGTPKLMNMPAANTAGDNKEGKDKDSVFFPLAKEWKDDVSEIKISGGVFIKADVAAKMFVVPVYGLSDVYRYIELEIDMSASVGTKITTKMGADKPIGLKLGELTFVPIAGVKVSFTPSIILEAEATIELMAELKGKTGFRYTTCLGNDTLESLHEEWKFTPHLELKGTVFLGFSMEPAVSFVHENVAKFGLEAKTGVEASASLKGEITDEYIHECLACIEGDIHVVLEGSVSAQLFKSKFLNLKVEFVGLKWKWGDFYYSATFEKAGFTKCPYKKYKVTVMAVENGGQSDEKPLENVVIKNVNNTNGVTEKQEEYITDKNGQTILYLSSGEHELMATKSGYKSQTKKVVVEEEPTGTFFDLEEGSEVVVRDRYSIWHSDKYEDDGVRCYHIPEIVIDGNNNLEINNVIYNELYRLLEEGYCISINTDKAPYYTNMSYKWGVKDNIVSVHVSIDEILAKGLMCYTYNIDLDTGESVDLETLCSYYNITSEQYYEKVKVSLIDYFDELADEVSNPGYTEYYEEKKQKSISDENISKAIPYINDNGDLCAIVVDYCLDVEYGRGYAMFNITGDSETERPECKILHTVEEEETYEKEEKYTEGSLEFNGHYYKLIEVDMSWEEAVNYCKELGGYMATISSSEENDFLYQMLLDSPYENAYFGYTDVEQEGVWKWVNGEESTYSNWQEGEPNDEQGIEEYAMFYGRFGNEKWNDEKFNEDLKVIICEWGDTQNNNQEMYKEYANAVQNYYNLNYNDEMAMGEYLFYALYDINNDGVDELICGINNKNYDMWQLPCIYTYNDGLKLLYDVNKENVWDWYKRNFWIYCNEEGNGGVGSFYSGTGTWRVCFRNLPSDIVGDLPEDIWEYNFDMNVYSGPEGSEYYKYDQAGNSEKITEELYDKNMEIYSAIDFKEIIITEESIQALYK